MAGLSELTRRERSPSPREWRPATRSRRPLRRDLGAGKSRLLAWLRPGFITLNAFVELVGKTEDRPVGAGPPTGRTASIGQAEVITRARDVSGQSRARPSANSSEATEHRRSRRSGAGAGSAPRMRAPRRTPPPPHGKDGKALASNPGSRMKNRLTVARRLQRLFGTVSRQRTGRRTGCPTVTSATEKTGILRWAQDGPRAPRARHFRGCGISETAALLDVASRLQLDRKGLGLADVLAIAIREPQTHRDLMPWESCLRASGSRDLADFLCGD